MLLRSLDRFFRHEAAGGVLLMLAALGALTVANSPLAGVYRDWLDTTVAVTIDGKGIEKPLLLWINDGLMAIFFFLIGLELKREMKEGRLRNPRDVVLPALAAAGGMAVPAAIYASLNWGDPEAIRGWAIPAATDIAFALGVLALLGDRVPAGLKVFLLTLAILDDMGAIVIIALFYTDNLSVWHLGLAAVPLLLMLARNMTGAHRMAPTLLLGLALWVLVLKSGVHATLAGVLTAFFVPLTDRYGKSPLHAIEHNLAPYVFFFIVPVFAFANAGVTLAGLGIADLVHPVTMGIAFGLVIGKIVGVLGSTVLMVTLGWARLPHGASWTQMLGVACLAGIGFTMSLFIGGLSFASDTLMNAVRLGVLGGSTVAALLGFAVLRATGPVARPAAGAAA